MNQTWIAGFRSAVVDPAVAANIVPSREFADETVLQVLHLGGGGERLRVRLSNRYGTTPLVIGAAGLALAGSEFDTVPDSAIALTFGGASRCEIPVGDEIVSDDVDLAVSSGADLLLSLYLPEPTGPATYAQAPVQDALVVPGAAGWRTDGGTLVAARYYVSGVDVLAAQGTPVVVAFGDS